MNVDEYLANFDAFLQKDCPLTPEIIEMQAKWDRMDARHNQFDLDLCSYIGSLSDDELDVMAKKFFARETKYEEWRYTHHNEQATSVLFERVIRAIEKQADHPEEYPDDMFLDAMFMWRGYTFKLYCGQGCFWRIEQNNKTVFQST